jgi:large subunit ribosomal protein L22
MELTARSKQKHIGMSHRKLRRVVNEIRGKKVPEALATLRFMPYFASEIVFKNLAAAVANAKQKYGELAAPERLFVSSVMVDEAAASRRFKPRAQGRVYKIEKPTAHLQIEVKVKAEER